MMSEKWMQIAKAAARELPKAHVLTYFQKTTILGYEKGILTIGLPREFFRGWHEQHSKMPILVAARGVWPDCRDVVFEVDGNLESASDFDPRDILAKDDLPEALRRKPKAVEQAPRVTIAREQIGFAKRFLNPDYTFETYVVGAGNSLAHAAAAAVSREPGRKYNPLFLFGGVGLGKTHLLHAIGNKIAADNPDASIVVMPTQNFIDEVVTAVRTGKGDRVREKFRANDVFMLDDIQFLKGKERTQEILFHIFNDLHHAGRQIVISSDCPPSELEGLEERLVSRFSMGMVADIQPPDFETRLAILREKMATSHVEFPPKVMDYIAEQINGSIRELLSVYNQMLANYELQGIKPNKTNVTEIIKKRNKLLRDELETEELAVSGRAISIDDIALRTAQYFEVPVEKLKSSSRLREYVVPRQLAMWFANKKLKEPMQKIGNYFGGRDHTSVLAGIRRVEMNKKTSTEFWRQMNELRKLLGY